MPAIPAELSSETAEIGSFSSYTARKSFSEDCDLPGLQGSAGIADHACYLKYFLEGLRSQI